MSLSNDAVSGVKVTITPTGGSPEQLEIPSGDVVSEVKRLTRERGINNYTAALNGREVTSFEALKNVADGSSLALMQVIKEG